MKITKNIPIIFIICLHFTFSSSQRLFDFCVADYKQPNPAGYPCKDPSTVTAEDFFGHGVLNAPAPSTFHKIFNAGISPAYVRQVPGLNGEGVSMARVDYQPGGLAPCHTHPGCTEIITVLKGILTVGFISTNNTVYMKSISEGDLFAIPQGLFHFQINSGNRWVLIILSLKLNIYI